MKEQLYLKLVWSFDFAVYFHVCWTWMVSFFFFFLSFFFSSLLILVWSFPSPHPHFNKIGPITEKWEDKTVGRYTISAFQMTSIYQNNLRWTVIHTNHLGSIQSEFPYSYSQVKEQTESETLAEALLQHVPELQLQNESSRLLMQGRHSKNYTDRVLTVHFCVHYAECKMNPRFAFS